MDDGYDENRMPSTTVLLAVAAFDLWQAVPSSSRAPTVTCETTNAETCP